MFQVSDIELFPNLGATNVYVAPSYGFSPFGFSPFGFGMPFSPFGFGFGFGLPLPLLLLVFAGVAATSFLRRRMN